MLIKIEHEPSSGLKFLDSTVISQASFHVYSFLWQAILHSEKYERLAQMKVNHAALKHMIFRDIIFSTAACSGYYVRSLDH